MVKPALNRRRLGLTRSVFVGWIAILAPFSCAMASNDSLEHNVKAAYLSKFGEFVQWPASAFPAPDSAVNLCIAGEDPFGVDFDTSMTSRRIGDRPVIVRHLTSDMSGSGCQILFVGGSDAANVARILRKGAGTGVLTVTETATGGDVPSIIQFVIQNDHVRFAVDDEAAYRSGITVSAKLLGLALSVNPHRPGTRPDGSSNE